MGALRVEWGNGCLRIVRVWTKGWKGRLASFDSASFDSASFDSASFDSASFDSASFDSASFDSAQDRPDRSPSPT
ncbi:MAG: hypothetical protein KJ675_06775, partial [Gammaproteobacteria bacterium]|nr:hypothetical protein [Gammaproteobacteria bacterium]